MSEPAPAFALDPVTAPSQPAAHMKLSSDTTVRYLVKLEQQPAGPYTVEGLESLVYLGKLTPESLVSPEGQDAFQPIRGTDLAKKLFPRLQEKTVPKAWGPPGQSDRHDLKEFKFSAVKFEKVNKDTGPRGQVEVKEILQEIRQAERDAGRDFMTGGRFKISKRSLDFWFMIIVGNLVLYGIAFFMGSTTSWVFAIGGSGLYSWGLIWSMYGVMDRY